MEKWTSDAPWWRTVRRFLLAFAPFLFLLLCLVALQLWNQVTREDDMSAAPAAAASAVTPAPAAPDEALLAHTPAAPPTVMTDVTSTAAPPSPTAPVPVLPEDAAIQLLGPPSGSAAAVNAPLSFYWSWAEQLQNKQRLTLYLITAEEEVVLDSLGAANLGASFHVRLNPSQAGIEPGEYAWEVRLEQGEPPQVLLRSETRRVILE